MPAPSIYLDECVDRGLAVQPRLRSHHATTAHDQGLLGASDEAQLAHAAQQDWIIVSHNMRDFRRLHASYRRQGRQRGGIILLPPSRLPQLEIRMALMLDWIATFPDHRSQLFRWHDLQRWLTQGNRLAGYSEVEVRLALGLRP